MKGKARLLLLGAAMVCVAVALVLVLGNAGHRRIRVGELTLDGLPQLLRELKGQYPQDARLYVFNSFGVDLLANGDGKLQRLTLELVVYQPESDTAPVVQLNYSENSRLVTLTETARLNNYEVDRRVELEELAGFLQALQGNETLKELIGQGEYSLQYGWPLEAGAKRPFLRSAGRIFEMDGAVTTEIIDDSGYVLPQRALGVRLFVRPQSPESQEYEGFQLIYFCQ